MRRKYRVGRRTYSRVRGKMRRSRVRFGRGGMR